MGAPRWARRPGAAAAAIAALTIGLLAGAAPVRATDAGDEAAFLASANALRASLGLAPFAVDAELTAISQRWSAVMAGAGDIWHNPDLADQVAVGRWVSLNENVGTGPGVTPIHAALLASPGHRANLVNPRYTHVGIGVAHIGNVLYVTQTFGRSAVSEGTAARAGRPAKATSGAPAAARPARPPIVATTVAPPPRGPTARLVLVLDQVRAMGV